MISLLGKPLLVPLIVFRYFCLISKPAMSYCTDFPSLKFSGDIVQKVLCPLSCVRYVSVNDMYVCVGCSSIYFDVFIE